MRPTVEGLRRRDRYRALGKPRSESEQLERDEQFQLSIRAAEIGREEAWKRILEHEGLAHNGTLEK